MGQFFVSKNTAVSALRLFFQGFSHYLEAALRLFYPASCAICRIMLELSERHVCASCGRNIHSLRLESTQESLVSRGPWIRRAWALYRYDSPLSDIISAVKFSGKWWLLDIFEEDLKKFCAENIEILKYDFIVPVPLDRGKRIHREFNQSEILAKKINSSLKLRLKNSLLKKRHATPAQITLDKKAREANLFGAFEARNIKAFKGKNILLVDDIFTTGATSREASRILKQAGAARIDLISLARTEIS